MSFFSKLLSPLKKVVRSVGKSLIGVGISAIPVVGPVLATVYGGVVGSKQISSGRGPPAVPGPAQPATRAKGKPAATALPGGGVQVDHATLRKFGPAAVWTAQQRKAWKLGQPGPALSSAQIRTLTTWWPKKFGKLLTQNPQMAQAQPVAGGGFISAGGTPTKFVTGTAQQPIGTGINQMSLVPALIQGASKLGMFGKIGKALPAIIGGGVIGAGIDEFFEGGTRKKRRRMNYGNGKATRRAIRRIKGARKQLQDIEKLLPKRTSRSRPRRDDPPGHTHVR